jgi:hypothetical protein|tara:strand:- start:2986 stop:3105 length:120 start_codon:yes stop_codon:yes gene_type:complete
MSLQFSNGLGLAVAGTFGTLVDILTVVRTPILLVMSGLL